MTTMRFSMCLAILLGLHAQAQAEENPVIAAWYAALAASDRDRFDALLSDNALVVLEDLGIEQTKDEFIAALDEWETAVEGAAIRYRQIDGGEDGMITVTVCYDFPDNQMLTRESFVLEGDTVLKSVQTGVSNDCGDL